ncbi:MAG: YncE family protein [Actinomycetota bacterium]|nr:YncE family protein [Actinomycetota bacterium]
MLFLVRRLLLIGLVVVFVPASQASRTGGTPVALVTAETLNRLLVVDLPSGHIRKRLRMPADPQNVETGARDAVVVSPRAGAVTLVGVPSLRVRKIFRGFASPHITLVLPPPHDRLAYVTDDGRGQLVVIDLQRKRVVKRIFVGLGAHHMSLSPDQRRLWIVLGERARFIAVVDTTHAARPRLLARVNARGLAHDVAFSPSGYAVWVTFDDRDAVSIFDPATGRSRVMYHAGKPPQHIAFASHNPYAYVTSGNDGQMRILLRQNGRLVRTVQTGYGSFNLGLSGGLIVSPSLYRGTLTELADSGRIVFSKRVAPAARDAAIAVLP